VPIELAADGAAVAGADLVLRPVFASEQPGEDPAGRAYAAAGREGEAGQTLLVGTEDGRSRLLFGVGRRARLAPEVLRRALAGAAREILGYATVGVELPAGSGAESITAAAEGILLGAHRYERFLTGGPSGGRRGLGRVLLGAPGVEAAEGSRALELGVVSAEAGIEARDLANTPANHCTPEDLALHAEEIGGSESVEVQVWRERELERERCGGILGVGRGSANPPRLLLLDYRGGGERAPIALLGKGITFDAGGTSIKHEEHLEWMKIDMSGGAAVLAAIRAIARLGLSVNVIGAVPCADNLTGPTAIKPGDVLTLRSGRTCEIVNTDYEGRVVLADALDVVRERSPEAILVGATLWGGSDALGDEISPLLGNDDALVAEVLRAASAAGEPAWRLPLWEPYRRELRSSVADLKNKPSNLGAMITAALFLGEFTGETPWAYLDLGDTAWAGRDWSLGPAGATGVPARTMLRFALERSRTTVS
jgi:leucyl aminopeptidase